MIYLPDMLDGWVGEGKARVILPITGPYVVHHGALGSFATIRPGGQMPSRRLRNFDILDIALNHQEAHAATAAAAD